MMNESYGFGSFRNKIWLRHSKNLAPEYQKGYHKIFLPLVKLSKTNKLLKKTLEQIMNSMFVQYLMKQLKTQKL